MALTGYEKAAVFLTAVGEEAASKILQSLDIKYVENITKKMAKLNSIRRATVESVLEEATELITNGDIMVSGDAFIRRTLVKSFGEADAEKLLEQATKKSALDSLKWVDAKTISNFVVTEHPQTIALIISLLESTKAAEVFLLLPEGLRADVSYRIATTERIPESVIDELNVLLKVHLDAGGGVGKKIEGPKALAEILNHCDRATESRVLESVEEKSTSIAESVRQLMFVFDDLAGLDDRSIQTLLKEVSTDDLTLALKTASQVLRDKIFKNMSQRASELLKDEMQTRGPARVSDVEKAQLAIVKVARKLEAEGKLVIAGKGDEELVV